MKFLCVSDQIDPLVYTNSIKERFADVDIVLCAGDLAMEYVDFIVSSLNVPSYFVFGNHNLNDYHLYHKDVPFTHDQRFNENNKQIYFGHGACYAGFKSLKVRPKDIASKRKTPVLIAGASGSIKYNNGLCQFTNSAMLVKLLKLVPKLILNKILYGRYLDIFLTHSPPRHVQDKEDPCHRGFECYRWFLKTFKPAYMVHGHIHLYDMQTPRITQFCDTTVLNVFSHYVLEMPDEVTDNESL